MNSCEVRLFDTKVGRIYELNSQIFFEFDKEYKYNISPFVFRLPYPGKHNFSNLLFNNKLAGVFADTLPDRYGMKIMDNFFTNKQINPSVIDRLLFIGNNGLGALKYYPNIYSKDDNKSYKTIQELQELYLQSKQIIKQDTDISLFHRNLLVSNASAGGARAKAVIMYNPLTNQCRLYDTYSRHQELPQGYIHAIIKFDELDKQELKPVDDVRIEYVYSQLAKECGVNMPNTYLSKTDEYNKQHFIIERFDNLNNEPLHMHSLAGLYNHNFDEMLDYDNIFKMAIYLKTPKEDIEQIYTRMIFNYIMRNQDDHAKNFSFLMNKNEKWFFSPAYDLMYNNGKKFTYEHKMLFNSKLGKVAKKEDFYEIANKFDIKNHKDIIEKIEYIAHTKLKKLLSNYDIQNNAIEEITNAIRRISTPSKNVNSLEQIQNKFKNHTKENTSIRKLRKNK